MSDAAPPFRPAGPGGEPQGGPLTPERIERVLADFRDWLTNLPAVEPPAPPPPATVDLHTLVGQFVALRHEVNLQTKAARASVEQNAEALRQLEEALDELRAPAPEPDDGLDEALKPLLKTLIDVYDALALAARQVERQHEKIQAGLATVLDAAALEPPPALRGLTARKPRLLQRLLGGLISGDTRALADWHARATRTVEERARAASDYLRQALDGLLTGYAMSLNRIERVLPQFGLEPMRCAGQRFDPESMEVVEVVAGSGRPSGEVVEEVRRGYLRDDGVFRYAQVRVAK